MKKTVLLSILLVGIGVAEAGNIKLYDVRSGKVDYTIEGSGSMMGQTFTTTGTKHLIFDDYGAKSLTEEDKTETQVIMGQTQTGHIHKVTYLNDGVAYAVDFDAKRIVRMEEMGAMMGMMTGGQKDVGKAGLEMMKTMGGKKVGTDKVLGYPCDVWELMGTRQCIYKGVPLRVESNIMGIKNTEVATSAAFDIDVADAFTLPDFPVYDMYGQAIDKSQLEKRDKQAQRANAKMQEGMAQMAEAFEEAAQKTGVQAGSEMSHAQEKAYQSAMLQAMLPQMKQQFLQQESIVRDAYACFHDADTREDAIVCSKKMSNATGEPEEEVSEWTPEAKKEVLQSFDLFLDQTLPCVKKAASMDALEQCLSD